MTLIEALDLICEGDWRNPIRPYFVSGITQTPYEAYDKLKEEYQILVKCWIEHIPQRNEDCKEIK